MLLLTWSSFPRTGIAIKRKLYFFPTRFLFWRYHSSTCEGVGFGTETRSCITCCARIFCAISSLYSSNERPVSRFTIFSKSAWRKIPRISISFCTCVWTRSGETITASSRAILLMIARPIRVSSAWLSSPRFSFLNPLRFFMSAISFAKSILVIGSFATIAIVSATTTGAPKTGKAKIKDGITIRKSRHIKENIG